MPAVSVYVVINISQITKITTAIRETSICKIQKYKTKASIYLFLLIIKYVISKKDNYSSGHDFWAPKTNV